LDIERALDQIPQDHATALRLFYLEELPVREIAREIGRPEGTIKRWLHLGRQHLALHMEEYAPMAAPTTASTLSPTAALIHTDLDPDLVKQITSALEAGDYATRLLSPTNPFSLVDSLKECQVAILDEWIGGRSALELVLHLKAHPETQRIPICLLCSSPSDFTTSAYFVAGIKRVVEKRDSGSIAELAKPIDKPLQVSHWLRFTESAKRVIFLSQSEANRLGEKDLVGPEHLLLGLVYDADTAAVHILGRLGIPLESVRAEIERQATLGESITEPNREMQLNPEAKHAINMAYQEAESLTSHFVGTQHLLVGVIRQGDSLATRVLSSLGVDLEKVRGEIPLVQAETMASGKKAQGTNPSSEQATA
jgi:hypothetical protein